MIQLRNERTRININPHGAEMTSWQVDGHEYLWQADPRFWARHAPVLFPIVGRLLDQSFDYDGKTFPLTQHGFARDSDFKLIDHSDTHAVFELRSSPETLKVYPFPFVLTLTYRLVDHQCIVTYTVHNPSDTILPFAIGAHPGFNVPFAGGTLEDYTLDFGRTRPLDQLLLDGPYVSGIIHELGDTRFLPLTANRFDNDALIFEGADYVAIRHVASQRAIVMESEGFTHLGIWSPPMQDAPFVCLEPWYGHADSIDGTRELLQKNNVHHLDPHATWTASYALSIES